VSGQWSPQELLLHINNLELLAVYRALLHWQTLVLDKVVLVVTDNTTVVSYINKQGGTRSRSLARTATEMLAYFFGLGVTIRAKHIAGKLNVLADSLSRKGQILPTEWSLSPQIFRQICKALGTPHIDLFATSLNTKLPVYVSPYPDPLAWDTDALSMSWEGIWGYAFPPTPIIPQVLNKVQSECCVILLIAPAFPGAAWFNQLLQLVVDVPRSLPPVRYLLSQPQSGVRHHLPESLALHAWLLSKEPCKLRDFRKGLPLVSLDRLGYPLDPSMMQNGGSSWLGAVNSRSIHSVSLFPS